jgi:hypothetical protein
MSESLSLCEKSQDLFNNIVDDTNSGSVADITLGSISFCVL